MKQIKYTSDTRGAWESALLKVIKEYVVTLWNISGKLQQVKKKMQLLWDEIRTNL
jgi:hypothetical protein